LGGKADEDLLAVGELAGEVERAEVYAAEWAAGERERVGDSGAGGRADEARAADLACDMNHQRGLAGGRARS
jgi:hypothetical protein